jgi:cyclase
MIANKKCVRLIARLDVKGQNLIKGVHLEGLRIIGSPQEYARMYYEQGADELLYMDIVASLYGRSNLLEIVRRTAYDIFVPLTVGGGVRSTDDANELLRAGADKIAINTAAVKRPALIKEVSRRFGSQCMVLSIEAKLQAKGKWEVYTDCGRESSGIDAVEWAIQGADLGAGEILVTSIDSEGTRKGFDTDLVSAISKSVGVPVIASGGFGHKSHLDGVYTAGADAIAFADVLHKKLNTIQDIRKMAQELNIPVRVVQ